MGVVVVCMSLEKEAIFSSRMKLLLLSYIFFLGYIHFGNASCNVTDRTNVLERAFGPVITSKLEDTCGDIKASFRSGLTEQKEQLEEMDTKLENLDRKMDITFENLDEKMDTKFEKMDEKIKGYIVNLVQQFGQILEAKLQEQKEDFNQKLEQQRLEIVESMEEKFIGEFDNWSEWGDCSTTCGQGTRMRTRRCLGSVECRGKHIELELCPNTFDNPRPTCTSEFGSWTEWSECSTTCGKGTRNRTRTCQGPFECIGEDTETEACPNNPTCTTIRSTTTSYYFEEVEEYFEEVEECTDSPPAVMNCYLLAYHASNCSNKTYAKLCCRTCTSLGYTVNQ